MELRPRYSPNPGFSKAWCISAKLNLRPCFQRTCFHSTLHADSFTSATQPQTNTVKTDKAVKNSKKKKAFVPPGFEFLLEL